MKKPTLILILTVSIVLLSLTVFGIISYVNRNNSSGSSTSSSSSITSIEKIYESNGFKILLKYSNNNSWKYTITGQLPSPCYKAVVDVQTKESFPEQVSIILSYGANPSTICAQVIQDYVYEKTLSASPSATFNFQAIRSK